MIARRLFFAAWAVALLAAVATAEETPCQKKLKALNAIKKPPTSVLDSIGCWCGFSSDEPMISLDEVDDLTWLDLWCLENSYDEATAARLIDMAAIASMDPLPVRWVRNVYAALFMTIPSTIQKGCMDMTSQGVYDLFIIRWIRDFFACITFTAAPSKDKCTAFDNCHQENITRRCLKYWVLVILTGIPIIAYHMNKKKKPRHPGGFDEIPPWFFDKDKDFVDMMSESSYDHVEEGDGFRRVIRKRSTSRHSRGRGRDKGQRRKDKDTKRRSRRDRESRREARDKFRSPSSTPDRKSSVDVSASSGTKVSASSDNLRKSQRKQPFEEKKPTKKSPSDHRRPSADGKGDKHKDRRHSTHKTTSSHRHASPEKTPSSHRRHSSHKQVSRKHSTDGGPTKTPSSHRHKAPSDHKVHESKSQAPRRPSTTERRRSSTKPLDVPRIKSQKSNLKTSKSRADSKPPTEIKPVPSQISKQPLGVTPSLQPTPLGVSPSRQMKPLGVSPSRQMQPLGVSPSRQMKPMGMMKSTPSGMMKATPSMLISVGSKKDSNSSFTPVSDTDHSGLATQRSSLWGGLGSAHNAKLKFKKKQKQKH